MAAGKNYISPRPAGRYTVLRLMHEIVPTKASSGKIVVGEQALRIEDGHLVLDRFSRAK